MLVVSFYTRSTIYEKEVEDLQVSCQSLSIEHYIEARPDLGSWERNTWQKPLFILECLEKFNRPLLWVDSDAVILQKPKLQLDCDIGLYFNDVVAKHARNGTIFVAPTEEAKNFMQEWYRLCTSPLNLGLHPDQTVMNWLLHKTTARIGHIPLEYTHVFDRDPVTIEQSVILHFQASRTAKIPPLFWENLTGRDLKALRMSTI
jgi:hypothetical protein